MASTRKKPVEEPATNGTTVAEQPAPQEPANGNGGKVIRVFSYPVSKDTCVQAQVHERTVALKNGQSFVTHEVTTNKLWTTATGEKKELYTFRVSELYALLHAIERAQKFCLDLREEDDCPL